MDKYPEVCTPEIVNNLKDDLLKLTKILDLIGTVDNSVVHKEFVILNKKIVGSCLAHLGFDNIHAATLSMRLHPAAAQLGINQANLAIKMNSHIKKFLPYLENGTEPEPEPEPEPEFSFPGHKYLNLRYKEEFPRVKDEYMDLVLKLHPDKGGDGIEFIQLRKEYAAIKNALGLNGGKKSNKNSNTKKLHNIKRKRISKRKRIRKRKSKKNKTKHYKNNSYFVRS
jgi:hypothetical protein